jgi:bifunctional DNase/RNase
MKIRGLVMDPASNMPIVILKDVKSDTVLPIWVGMYEANAIALEIEKSATPRPMTHDLLKNLVRGLNASVQKVVVTELKNDTFYAVIWMEQEGEVVPDLRERRGDPDSQARTQHGGDHAGGTSTLAGRPERRGSRPV